MIKLESIDDVYRLDYEMSTPGVRDGLLANAEKGGEDYEIIQDEDGFRGAFMRTSAGLYPLGSLAPVQLAAAPTETMTDAVPQGPEIKAYDPTTREQISAFLQSGLEGVGVDRVRARKISQSLIGGPSSGAPLSLGIADIIPFLGTALQTEEAVRLGEDAASFAEQGKYTEAAISAAGAAIGMIPGAVGTTQAVKKVAPAFRGSGDALAPVSPEMQAGVVRPSAFMPSAINKNKTVQIAPDLTIDIAPPVRTKNFKNWFGDWSSNPEDASKVVDDNGAPIVVYHGTQRPDRIGTQFRKSRATSGPMSFFTDDPEIASGYAKGKQDTSLAYEDTNYANWFKKKEGRTTLNLEQVGARMSQQEKQEVLDKLRRVGQDDQGNIVIGEGLVGDQTFDFMLKDSREAGGNPLKLANKLWLESGTLYGREEDFSKVLDAIGVKGFEQDFPTSTYPAIYPVYLSVKNPLDTSEIDQRTMYALEWNAKRQRKPRALGGADPWDKRMRDPKEWIKQLKEDMEEGKSSMVWTSIPDWVTKTLKAEGYDGIKDVGGKSGGMPHTVWIPFEPTQIKSAVGNIGTFDPKNPSIVKGVVPTAGVAAGAATTMQDNEERM